MKAKHFHLENEFVVENLRFTFPASWKHFGNGGFFFQVVKDCFRQIGKKRLARFVETAHAVSIKSCFGAC